MAAADQSIDSIMSALDVWTAGVKSKSKGAHCRWKKCHKLLTPTSYLNRFCDKRCSRGYDRDRSEVLRSRKQASRIKTYGVK